MEVLNIWYFLVENKAAIISLIPQVIGIAAIIVKLTPTVKDDTILKAVIKFVGKFIALNHTVDPAKQKIANKAKLGVTY